MQNEFKKGFSIGTLALALTVAGCNRGPAKGAPFDVPAIALQDFAAATSMLGAPASNEISNDAKGAARVASWDDAQGDTVTVFYDSTTKKPASIIFTIPDAQASPDKEKVLKAGKLSLDDPRYSLKFMLIARDKNKVVGVAVKPLAP